MIRAGTSARAVGLAGAGIGALVASRGFGTPALATLGAGLLALPVLVTALVWLAASGIRVERRIEPARPVAGEPVRARVTLTGWATGVGLDRILDVSTDPGLGTVAGPVAPAHGGGVWLVDAVRGDHVLPPATASIRDPFGVALRTRAGRTGDRLLVVPASPALAGVPVGARARGTGVRRRGTESGFGELDRVRDYQPGDSLSRVHWAQTAKRGRLQTKEMRPPQGSGRSVVLLLDGAAAPGEGFETVVTATAALARHLIERRDPVVVAHTGRVPVRLPPGRGGWPAVELALARAEAGGVRALALALRSEATALEPPELVVVLTSASDGGLAGAVAQARAMGVEVAVVLAGPAAAGAAELVAMGSDVVVIPGPDRVATALGAPADRARVS